MSQSRPVPTVGTFAGNYFLGRPSYVRYLKAFSKAIYPFINDPDNPFTFTRPDGLMIRPLATMETDMGTVPRSVRVLISKDRYLDSYIIHDSGYMQGGFSVSRDCGKTWGVIRVSRKIVDQQLRDCIRAQGANRATRNAVYFAVRSAGGGIWKRRHGAVSGT